MPQELQQLRPGDVFAGRYRVVRLIRAGVVGAVYEAEDTATRRHRALKLMHPQLVRDQRHLKGRWIDGTPEYSLCIYGLLELFPEARFIHIVRDVGAVVRSMVRFSANGVKLVQNQREAFDYWSTSSARSNTDF